ncbi:MAG TPA: ABC transporter permease [Candidatus Tectomicrobia bacterium]|nr:ABC transporter permease [Candidatus Tectomicrobia bacterium]
MSAVGATARAAGGRATLRRAANRHGWTVGVYVLLAALVAYWTTVPARFGSFDVQTLAIDALPLAFVAIGQAIVVLSGGIDLSVGSLISLMNVLSARFMVSMSTREAILFALLFVLASIAAGAVTGGLIVLTRVPDIIATLAMLFVWAGVALVVLEVPGGGAPLGYVKLGSGYTLSPWLPTGLVILVATVALVWLPLRWRRPGLALYAIGSNRARAYLSGVPVSLTRVGAYALGGGFAGLAGLTLTATSGVGDPLSGQYYTLNSVAAVVLGGVSLLGGVGGVAGPIAAAFILTLVKTLMILQGVDQNYAQVFQGTLIILVVMVGGLALRQKGKSGT